MAILLVRDSLSMCISGLQFGHCIAGTIDSTVRLIIGIITREFGILGDLSDTQTIITGVEYTEEDFTELFLLSVLFM